MQLLFLIVVLATLTAADVGPTEPAGNGYWRFAGVLGGMAIVTLTAMATARLTVARLRRWPEARHRWLVRFAWYRRLHIGLWSLVAAATVFGLGWGQVVRIDWGLGRAVLLDELLLLAPALLTMLLAWAAYYDVERLLGDDEAQDDVCSPDAPRGRWQAWSSGRLAFVALRFRHHVALWLLPLLIVVGVQDAARHLWPDWSGPEHAAGIVIAAVIVVMLLFPQVLRIVWRAYPLPSGPLRERLEAEARERGFRFRDFLVWPTNDSLAGAAVAGIVPRLRYVFFSDRLLENLSDEEVAAVLAHEMGHVRHGHMLLRLGLLLTPLLVWQIVVASWPSLAAWVGVPRDGGAYAEPSPMLVAIATLVVLGLYMATVFGYWSRRLEMQADLFACQGDGKRRTASVGNKQNMGREAARLPEEGATVLRADGESPRAASCSKNELASRRTEIFISALEKLAWLNGTDHHRATWQHGSIARRVQFVRGALNHAHEARRVHRQVRLLAACLVTLLALGGIGCVLGA